MSIIEHSIVSHYNIAQFFIVTKFHIITFNKLFQPHIILHSAHTQCSTVFHSNTVSHTNIIQSHNTTSHTCINIALSTDSLCKIAVLPGNQIATFDKNDFKNIDLDALTAQGEKPKYTFKMEF